MTLEKIMHGVAAVLVVAGGIALYVFVFSDLSDTRRKDAVVRLPDATVVPVDLALTKDQQIQGLSGRASLPKGSGMLFVFNDAGTYGFWMKDMNFPIDIVWLRATEGRLKNGTTPLTVISIDHAVRPDSFPQRFSPSSPADHVLEVNAGFAKEHGLEIGQRLLFESEIPLR